MTEQQIHAIEERCNALALAYNTGSANIPEVFAAINDLDLLLKQVKQDTTVKAQQHNDLISYNHSLADAKRETFNCHQEIDRLRRKLGNARELLQDVDVAAEDEAKLRDVMEG